MGLNPCIYITCAVLYRLHNFLCIVLYHKNLKYKHLIDDIPIDLWSLIFLKFCNYKIIIKICNLMVRFSKFTFNKKILEESKRFLSKLIWKDIFLMHITMFNLRFLSIPWKFLLVYNFLYHFYMQDLWPTPTTHNHYAYFPNSMTWHVRSRIITNHTQTLVFPFDSTSDLSQVMMARSWMLWHIVCTDDVTWSSSIQTHLKMGDYYRMLMPNIK